MITDGSIGFRLPGPVPIMNDTAWGSVIIAFSLVREKSIGAEGLIGKLIKQEASTTAQICPALYGSHDEHQFLSC